MNSKLVLIGLLLVLFSTQAYALDDTNLVAWWNFDETSGTTLIDVKDYDLNGTNTNATINQTGKIGKAYNNPSGIANIQITNSSALQTNSSGFAYGGWVKLPASLTAERFQAIMARDATDTWANINYRLYYFTTTDSFYCGLGNTAGTSFQANKGGYARETWYNVMCDYNTTHIRLFVNGTLEDSVAFSGTLVTNALNKLTFFRDATLGGVYIYPGYLDEMSFWNKSLTQEEITELYNSGNGITYPFDEASFSYLTNPEEGKVYLYDTSNIGEVITDWNWLVDGLSISTDQNTSFIATEFTDYNVCLIINDGDFSTCETINSGRFFGRGFIKLYDSSNNELDQVSYVISPAINGVSSGVLTDNNLDLNFTAITSSNYTFTFSKSSYTTLSFTLPLTQYTNFDYNFVMLDVNKTTNVNFQVFNESGAYAKTKTFYAYDYSLNKYVGIQTTDTLGRLTFNLDQTKSDYNFFSADFNFGTTIWNINKPKDIVTLSDINGTWGYSITGPSYSNASNIAAGIQKLLLQNTVYPYLIKIVDTGKSYASTTFGLKSVTSEKEKTLTPYLYKYADADLKLIKLIDFATNQPHSSSEELTLSLYTDNNGLIPIGIFVNDSTGTYNIYMDENATYELQVLSQSYNLRPTLDIYYLYLTEDIGVIIDNNLIVDVNAPIMDANLPIIFTQLREAVFGCSSTTDNCYPSMIFSLIAVALLLIVLAISGQIGAISQSITIGILLTMFLIIGFIPLWLYGVGVVILIAWGVFGQ